MRGEVIRWKFALVLVIQCYIFYSQCFRVVNKTTTISFCNCGKHLHNKRIYFALILRRPQNYGRSVCVVVTFDKKGFSCAPFASSKVLFVCLYISWNKYRRKCQTNFVFVFIKHFICVSNVCGMFDCNVSLRGGLDFFYPVKTQCFYDRFF